MIKALLTMTLLVWAGATGASCDPWDTNAAIAHLLAEVRASDVIFVRNGRAHEPQRAAVHMARKYDHFRDRIDSAESFIALAATRSELTGRAYKVRLGDGTEMPSAAWLTSRLSEWRSACEDKY